MNEINPSTAIPLSRWPNRVALATIATTLLLIVMGGLVTNTGSALAVPDWPTTFGQNMFLYPWSKMVGGIFYEHTHRLIGSVVGLLTVSLALVVWRSEPRVWVRAMALVAVVAVVVQGILGGLRVVLLQHGLAPIHGSFAQAFLGLLVAIAVVTSNGWHTVVPREAASAPRLRLLARVLGPLVYVQLVFGAVLTHTGARLDAHLFFAIAVTLSICLLAVEVLVRNGDHPYMRPPVVFLLCLLGIQLSLGLGAYLWRFTYLSEALTPAAGLALLAAHRLTGTALWAATVVVVLRVLRLATTRRASMQSREALAAEGVPA